jgi:hypothetical protein
VRGHRPRPGSAGSWSWPEAKSLFRDRSLLVLDGGIFTLHAAVTGLFVVVPFMLRDRGIADLDLWRVYAPLLAAGLAAMMLASRLARQRAATRCSSVRRVVAGLVGWPRSTLVPAMTVFSACRRGFASIGRCLALLAHRRGARHGANGSTAVQWAFMAAPVRSAPPPTRRPLCCSRRRSPGASLGLRDRRAGRQAARRRPHRVVGRSPPRLPRRRSRATGGARPCASATGPTVRRARAGGDHRRRRVPEEPRGPAHGPAASAPAVLGRPRRHQ